MYCRICGKEVVEFLNLGHQPRANAFVALGQDVDVWYKLAVGKCIGCHMVQLLEQPEPAQLFKADYPFFTATSQRMATHLAELAEDIKERYNPEFVLEIGGNDGTLLFRFECRTLNMEPSRPQAQQAQTRGVPTLLEFATPATLKRVEAEHGRPDVVVATNAFCHIPGLKRLLETFCRWGSIVVFEDPYLGGIISSNGWDQFYDEHVFYFSVESIQNLAQQVDYNLDEIRQTPVHGGSMRYYLSPGFRQRLSYRENWSRDINVLSAFEAGVRDEALQLKLFLTQLGLNGQSVCGYGATSKSTVIFNYCGIGPSDMSYIVDSTPAKQGRLTPGSRIPVLPPTHFQQHPTDVCLVLAWNHFDEIVEKESWYRGRWIKLHDTYQ